jgi:hypothetical protein
MVALSEIDAKVVHFSEKSKVIVPGKKCKNNDNSNLKTKFYFGGW